MRAVDTISLKKQFSLDGIDGIKQYWHDLRTKSNLFTRLNELREVFNSWGLTTCEKTQLAILEASRHSFIYVIVLKHTLMPFFKAIKNKN